MIQHNVIYHVNFDLQRGQQQISKNMLLFGKQNRYYKLIESIYCCRNKETMRDDKEKEKSFFSSQSLLYRYKQTNARTHIIYDKCAHREQTRANWWLEPVKTNNAFYAFFEHILLLLLLFLSLFSCTEYFQKVQLVWIGLEWHEIERAALARNLVVIWHRHKMETHIWTVVDYGPKPLLTVMRVFIYGKRNAHTINFAIYQPKNQFKLRICVM